MHRITAMTKTRIRAGIVLSLLAGLLTGSAGGYIVVTQHLYAKTEQLNCINVQRQLTDLKQMLSPVVTQRALTEQEDSALSITPSLLQEWLKEAVAEVTATDNASPRQTQQVGNDEQAALYQTRTDDILLQLDSDPNAITMQELDDIIGSFPQAQGNRILNKVTRLLNEGSLSQEYFLGQ